jgi:hypothetical protein
MLIPDPGYPGFGMFIPDPDFYPSWIPDIGSPIPNPTTATKEEGKKLLSYRRSV